jgi:hypothetical protein
MSKAITVFFMASMLFLPVEVIALLWEQPGAFKIALTGQVCVATVMFVLIGLDMSR